MVMEKKKTNKRRWLRQEGMDFNMHLIYKNKCATVTHLGFLCELDWCVVSPAFFSTPYLDLDLIFRSFAALLVHATNLKWTWSLLSAHIHTINTPDLMVVLQVVLSKPFIVCVTLTVHLNIRVIMSWTSPDVTSMRVSSILRGCGGEDSWNEINWESRAEQKRDQHVEEGRGGDGKGH